MKKEDIAASEILLDLPEINYDHLKEMTAFTVQELQRDRLALA